MVCDANAQCVSLPQSDPVADEVPDVVERSLGEGRHSVAARDEGLAAAFVEVLETGDARVAVATFSSMGDPLGVWRSEPFVAPFGQVWNR